MDVKRFYFLPFFLCLSLLSIFFCMRLVFLLSSSFFQPACRCLQTTWRLTVICSRFPKPTTLARKKPTGLRNHARVLDIMAAATQLGEVGMVSNTPTTTMTSPLRRTCGPRMNMATEGVIHHPATTGTMPLLAATRPRRVTLMIRGPPGQQRRTPRTLLCTTIPLDDLRLQEGVVSQGQEDITLLTTQGIHLDIIMAKELPGRETHIGPHAASPRDQ